MTGPHLSVDALKRPVVLIGIALAVVAIIVWLVVFFVPQGHKLSSLQTEKSSLQQTVVQDNARLQRLKSESHHVAQIKAMYGKLEGYAPATEDLYTYIHVLSGAAKSAGITITSLEPNQLTAVSGTVYSAVPITAIIKGTYPQVVNFLHLVDTLPRLTAVNGLTITGGGPGANQSVILTVNLQLAIFTTEKPAPS